MRGIVFGIFDGLHEGHKHFLSEAAGKCDELVIVVASDTAARALKKRTPRFPLPERMNAVAAFSPAAQVVAGDDEQGSWQTLTTYAPDIVILGYDQEAIADELEARSMPYLYLSPHEPDRFKSSILNGTIQPPGDD